MVCIRLLIAPYLCYQNVPTHCFVEASSAQSAVHASDFRHPGTCSSLGCTLGSVILGPCDDRFPEDAENVFVDGYFLAVDERPALWSTAVGID
jgi:hypothetical protein